MDCLAAQIIKDIYQGSDSTESKIKEMRRLFPALNKNQMEDDLTAFFNYTVEQLPIIKGVEVETSKDGFLYNYVMITQMLKQILPEVQKTLMRIMGCLGGFTYQKWGIGKAEEGSSIRKHLDQYLQTHPEVTPIPGKEAGYPKVFEFDYQEVDAARNESYVVTEIMGLILS
ncbi:MAG: hypothetical protein NC419_06160 [Muribaculaceae bacterium]|nr:hypothetical protein [Muribaculaceae bacterium]